MKVAGFGILASCLVCCSTSSQVGSPNDERVAQLFERITRDIDFCIRVQSRSPVHGFNEQAWMDVWYQLTGPEREFVSCGVEAKDRLIRGLREPAPHPLYHATYLRILGQLRDSSLSAVVLEVLERERDPRVTTECLRALALTRDPSLVGRLRQEFCRPGIRVKRLLWALAMVGDPQARDDFLGMVEALVRARPLANGEEETNPVPDVPSAAPFAHLLQPPNNILFCEDLTEDLTDISLLRELRSVRILIEGLSSSKMQVIQTSKFLLTEVLDIDLRREPSIPWSDAKALYTRGTYRAMVDWWKTKGAMLRWDAGKSKFVLP